MKKTRSFSYAIRSLLSTAAAVLLLNFACANAAGVRILNWFGLVEDADIDLRHNILEGVALMQWIIIAVIVMGLSACVYFLVRGIIQIRKKQFQS